MILYGIYIYIARRVGVPCPKAFQTSCSSRGCNLYRSTKLRVKREPATTGFIFRPSRHIMEDRTRSTIAAQTSLVLFLTCLKEHRRIPNASEDSKSSFYIKVPKLVCLVFSKGPRKG